MKLSERFRGRVPRLLGPAGGLRARDRHAHGAGRPSPRSPGRSRRRSQPTSTWPPREVDSSGDAEGRRRDAGPRDARGAARREALPARGQGHPVRLQGPRPVREVARGPPGTRPLRRSDRAADGRGAELRSRSPDGELVDPMRLRPRLLPAERELEDGGARSSCATTTETMREIYPGFARPDTDWSELREFYCPSCARQLEVEAVPPGYPVSTSSSPTSRASTAAGSGARSPEKEP